MTQISQIEIQLEEAMSGVATARLLLEQGNPVDLAGLETRIAEICDSVGDLPVEHRDGLKSRLVGLIDDLNTLADTLAVQHAHLTAALKDTTNRHRAVSAYGTGSAKPANRPKK